MNLQLARERVKLVPFHDLPNYPPGFYSPTATTIVRGPDGNMWFVEMDADRTGRVTL